MRYYRKQGGTEMTALIVIGIGVAAIVIGATVACMWVCSLIDDEQERRMREHE